MKDLITYMGYEWIMVEDGVITIALASPLSRPRAGVGTQLGVTRQPS